MKKHIIRTLVALGILVSVFGAAAVKSHLDTVRQGIRQTVREAVPAEYEINRIRALIDGMSEEVFEFREKIGEIETTVRAKRAEATQLEKSVAADLRDLVTEKDMLNREGDEFTVRGVTYRRPAVEASAKARMARIKRDQSKLALLKEAIVPLERDVADGRERLAEAVSVRDDKLRELELLAVELKNAELRGDLAELSKPLKDGLVTRSASELTESLKAFSRRVRREQRRVAAVTNTASPDLIVHESATQQPGVVDELEAFLAVESPATGQE